MSYIGRLQSVSFDTYRAPSPLGFTMQQTLHWTSSGSLIMIGLAIALIASPHLVTHSVLVPSLSVGRARSRLLFLYLQPEAEYKGVVNITIQAMWLQHFLTELGIQFHQSIVIWCDNQSTLKFCRDPVQRQWMKHIEIHMHYIWDLVHEGIIDLQFCPSAEQTADIFTKTFTEQKFHSLRSRLGVKDTVA
jgi:hypothetical protein